MTVLCPHSDPEHPDRPQSAPPADLLRMLVVAQGLVAKGWHSRERGGAGRGFLLRGGPGGVHSYTANGAILEAAERSTGRVHSADLDSAAARVLASAGISTRHGAASSALQAWNEDYHRTQGEVVAAFAQAVRRTSGELAVEGHRLAGGGGGPLADRGLGLAVQETA